MVLKILFQGGCPCFNFRFQRRYGLLHDFMVFDSGVKKVCRHNQYFGVKAAQDRVAKREGGIIWHTQGSGKSLTMVWLAKWLREHQKEARVLLITDRTELDDILKTEQQSLTRDIESLELRLVRTHLKVAELEHVLRRTLEFLYQPQEAYLAAPPALRRQLNQAVWDQILVFDNEPAASGTVSEPFATLLDPGLVVPIGAAQNPAAIDTASWVAGRPGWIGGHLQTDEGEHLARRAQRRGKGLKDGHLAAQKGRHSNPRPPLGVGLKEGGLAPPTGFEPVLPP